MRGSAGRLLDGEGRKSEADHWAGGLGWGVPVAEKCSGGWAVTHVDAWVKPCRMSTPSVRVMHVLNLLI